MFIFKKIVHIILSFWIKAFPSLGSKYLYYRKFGELPNLKNPKTFNEKLMWLKLYEDDSLKVICADKYRVREYLNQIGYSSLLIDLYNVYEDVDEIDFKQLPNRFVMKCTHGSGFNIICKNKGKLNEKETRLLLKKWMAEKYSIRFCEPHYSKIKPRIIVEKFLEDGFSGEVPIDYMIHCFNGVPRVIEVGLENGGNEKKYSTYNTEWEKLSYYKDSVSLSETINKPEKIEEILKIARNLSEEFTYVRVDLYYCQNQIYFGELTFTPGACLEGDFINDADYQLGKLLNLPRFEKIRPSLVSIPQYFKGKMIDLAHKIWPMLLLMG
jgi:hypothetical protein